MNWWRRFKAWFSRPDESEEPTLIPDGTQPIPSDMFVPGESQRVLVEDQPCQRQPTR